MPPNQREAKIPNTIDRAFSGCSNLTSITIPASVKSLGWGAFFGCNTITFGANSQLESIGEYAFSSCSFTEITIPANVTSIGGSAFNYCDNLQMVNWNATNCTQAGDSNHYIFSHCESLITVNIGENVQTIPEYAFCYCSFTEIAIPASVTSIGNYAFRGCSELTEIAIPASVTSIGYEAFCYCTNLQTVNFENPDSWKVSHNSDMWYAEDILQSDLQNQATAAQYLRDTYCDYYWERS